MSEAIDVSRVVAASSAATFRAWTEPEHIRRWWRPHGLTASSVAIDLRPGGRYRIGMGGDGADEVFVAGAFTELDPPRRLVYTWEWESGEFADAGESLVTVEFRPVDGGTEVAVRHVRLPAEARPAHEGGWADCLGALGAAI